MGRWDGLEGFALIYDTLAGLSSTPYCNILRYSTHSANERRRNLTLQYYVAASAMRSSFSNLPTPKLVTLFLVYSPLT